MKHRVVLLCLVVLQSYASSQNCYVTLEAESGSYTGSVMTRDMASNGHTVLLTAYKSVVHDFTVFDEHIVTVAGVFYSNDGESDNVSLTIDGKLVDSFETQEDFGNGHLWNVFRNTGELEKSLHIRPGDHELQILVTSLSANGVEIDRIVLEVNCSRVKCDDGYDTCPGSVIEVRHFKQNKNDQNLRVLLSSSENTLGLAGVVIGSSLGLLNTCIIAGLACHKLYKNRAGRTESSDAKVKERKSCCQRKKPKDLKEGEEIQLSYYSY